MNLPSIDYKFWYLVNQNDAKANTSHHALITLIENIYLANNEYRQSYFCGNVDEVKRLKRLDYNQLENEIINKIRSINDIHAVEHSVILEIFDLIQIWGGLQGGSNFYQIKNNSSQRLNYREWINDYIQLISYSIDKKISAYDYVKSGKIKNLKMSFGSKHISFWSRKISDINCLVIIDNKIAGVFGRRNALEVNHLDLVRLIHEKSSQLNIEPYKVEKALFSFHKNYFDNSNTRYIANSKLSHDLEIAIELKNVLGVAEIPIVQSKKVNRFNSISTKIALRKGDFIKSKSGRYFISEDYLNSKFN